MKIIICLLDIDNEIILTVHTAHASTTKHCIINCDHILAAARYFHVMIIEQKVEKLKRVAGATSRTGIYTV